VGSRRHLDGRVGVVVGRHRYRECAVEEGHGGGWPQGGVPGRRGCFSEERERGGGGDGVGAREDHGRHHGPDQPEL